MSLTKKILIGILLLFVVIQFIRPERNSGSLDNPNDIFFHRQASDSVKSVIKTACYNCHSDKTEYPWYANIQPLGLWLQHHVDEGKEELNFSEFAAYPEKKAIHKMEEIVETVKSKEMPLESYALIHKEADITDEQRKLIMDWAKKAIGK